MKVQFLNLSVYLYSTFLKNSAKTYVRKKEIFLGLYLLLGILNIRMHIRTYVFAGLLLQTCDILIFCGACWVVSSIQFSSSSFFLFFFFFFLFSSSSVFLYYDRQKLNFPSQLPACLPAWGALFKAASTHPICLTIWNFIWAKYCPSMKLNIWAKYFPKLFAS